MREVIVISEGQTEEAFIKQVVAPFFRPQQIYLKPVLMNTSSTAKGGAVNYDRLKINVRNLVKSRPEIILTTFFDLYGLDSSFPSFHIASKLSNVYQRVETLEKALHKELVSYVGCRPEKIIPYIQPYEFEGLLFSDVKKLCSIEPDWHKSEHILQAMRDKAESPEHINDSYETKPAKRLEDNLRPKYKKTTHGPRISKHIGIDIMERECVHFKTWLDQIRALV